MSNPQWSSDKKRLARRIYTGYILRELSFWVPGGLLCWGLMVFLVRFASFTHAGWLWSGSAFVFAAVGVGVYRGYQQAADVHLTAVLDYLTDSDNLLVSLEETGTENDEWVSMVKQRIADGVPMPGFRWGVLTRSILPAIAFLLLVWFVPLSGLSNQKANASGSYLQERVEELRDKLEKVEDEDLVTDEKAKRMEKKLDNLQEELSKKNLSGDNPWSVMDRVDHELDKEMTERSDTLSRARNLSRSLSEEMKRNQAGEQSEDTSSRSSTTGSESMGNANQEKEGRNLEGQLKEELSRSLARLSRRDMISPSSSPESQQQDSPYEDRQVDKSRKTSTGDDTGKRKKRNWKKLVSNRKALKKLRRKLEEKHRRMHKKGVCRGGRCQSNRKGSGRKSTIARGNGKTKRSASSSEKKSAVKGKKSQAGTPSGKPGADAGTAPMTGGNKTNTDENDFSTKRVDAPIVNAEGVQKVAERMQDGVNQKPGEASASSGGGATVENPLESRRSSVPPPYRDSVRSYFSPETEETD